MRICLMADIPNNFILGRIKNPVKSNCKLDHTEIRRQMTAVLRNRIYENLSDFLRQKRQIIFIEIFYVRRRFYFIKILH